MQNNSSLSAGGRPGVNQACQVLSVGAVPQRQPGAAGGAAGIRDLLLLLTLTASAPVPCRCCPATACCRGCCLGAPADGLGPTCNPAVPLGLLLALESLATELPCSDVLPSFCMRSRVSLSRSVTPAAPAACTCATNSFICSSDSTAAAAGADVVLLLGCRKGWSNSSCTTQHPASANSSAEKPCLPVGQGITIFTSCTECVAVAIATCMKQPRLVRPIPAV
jgi:hypothetical protein